MIYNGKLIFRFYHILLISIIIMVNSTCESDQDNNTEPKIHYTGSPKIEFINTNYDFGNLKAGQVAECTFIYKNIGTAPLKIISVDADCGCTVPEFSSEEILPGKEGKIKAVFNSDGFRNNIYKTIDVETNAGSEIIELVLTAFIESKLN